MGNYFMAHELIAFKCRTHTKETTRYTETPLSGPPNDRCTLDGPVHFRGVFFNFKFLNLTLPKGINSMRRKESVA